MTIAEVVGDVGIALAVGGGLLPCDVTEKHAKDRHRRRPDISFRRRVKVSVDGPGSKVRVDLFWRETSASWNGMECGS
jgi:hypothetical protein